MKVSAMAGVGWHYGADGAWWYWDGSMWTARVAPTPPRSLRLNLRDPWTRPLTVAGLISAAIGVLLAAVNLALIPAVATGAIGDPFWLNSLTLATVAITFSLQYLLANREKTSPTPPEAYA